MWKLFHNKNIAKYGGKLIFESNLNQNDIKINFHKPGFLQGILLAWNKIKPNIKPVHILGKEIIWNNLFLKIGGRTFSDKTFFDRGIQFIEHIYDYRKNDFFDFRDFINVYELPNKYFLFYTSIVSCIPKEWKLTLKNENIKVQANESLFKQLLKSKHVNKYLYDFQLKSENIPKAKSEESWAKDFSCNVFNVLLSEAR